jgi:peptidoglycan hydrolase-like protein with peptidoglycan-binding domain
VVQPTNVLRLTEPMMGGARVRKVQQALAGLGLLPGEIDAVYGPQTQDAVRLFQAAHGLVADGEVGDATWRALGLD